MQGNARAPVGSVQAEIKAVDEVWAFDELPPRLRRLLADGPVPISATHVLNHYRQAGEREVVTVIRRSFDHYLNAMAKETGVPRCYLPLLSQTHIGSGASRNGSLGSELPLRVRRRLNLPASALTIPTVVG